MFKALNRERLKSSEYRKVAIWKLLLRKQMTKDLAEISYFGVSRNWKLIITHARKKNVQKLLFDAEKLFSKKTVPSIVY